LERGSEVAAIARRVEQARQGGGALVVVEGLAGAGKTALLQLAVNRARAQGTLVLEGSGTELERELGFGVVRALFERTLVDAGAAGRRAVLAGAARMAAPVVRPRSSRGSVEPASVVHGLYWLVSNLAEMEPLMMVVDDTHWADRPSLQFLAYLARRLGDLPVLLVVAMRPSEPAAHADLVAVLRGAASQVLTPEPLSEFAVGQLVAERFDSEPSSEFVAACHVATGGNPFLVGELIAALSADLVTPTADNAVRVGKIGPQTVSSVLLARISRIGAEARALTEAVAVLGGGELRHAASLAQLRNTTCARVADALAQIAVLGSTRPLQFVHPLVHAAVYEAIPPGQRSITHGAAARLLAGDGAGADRVALHLLNTEPAGEGWVVEALRAAATEARARGAPDLAADYLRRAMTEPPVANKRSALMYELGAAELLARKPSATEHLAQAFDACDSPETLGEIALLLGRAAVSTGRLADARQLLTPIIEQLAQIQPGVAARLEAYRSAAGLWDPRFFQELGQDLPRLTAVAERAGASGRSLFLLIAFRATFEGRPRDEVLALVERGLDHGRLVKDESAEAIEITWAARVLTFTDELDRADGLLDAMAADAGKRGSVMGYATTCAWRAGVALRRGLIGAAEADARSAVDLVTAHGLHAIAPHAYSFLGEALIELGELEQAAELLQHADLGPMQGSRPEARFLHTRARVSLARGDNRAAIADLRAGEAREPWFQNPNAMAWRSTMALALPQGSRREALELIDLELEQARRIGQPRAIGVAMRARGLLCRGEEQIAHLEAAVATLETCPSVLELARALTDLGAALRRASRRSEAREHLARALDLASACGASALARRARDELVTAGARPRRDRTSGVEALTASERRVAQMAAAGLSNREIAQALFVTMKAVALHLTHVYEKLDIEGRMQLPTAIAG
jgi:DNA-binding CsgD family transcriptional regulator/tetratricopeptide (TPR) repeat protein